MKDADGSVKNPWLHERGDGTRVWRDNLVSDIHIFDEYPMGLFYGLFSRKPILLREDYYVFVMNDGIIYASSFQYTGRRHESRIVQVDWKEAYLVDVADGRVTIERRGQSALTVPKRFNEEGLKPFIEKVDIRQRTGELPHNVPFVYKETRKPVPEKTVSIGRFVFSTLQILFVLAVVAIGYPLFLGGGSLIVGTMPPVAEIAPDATALAVSRHPEWPAMRKLELTAGAAAFHAAPAEWLANSFGIHGNQPAFLLFVPVFWATQFLPRDKQVEVLAWGIENGIQREATEGQAAASADGAQ
ncbi:MAG: hypothetical protein KGI75_07770 [Rhizobiaceae bacterium]|nr:hypothetical protein [Rhizobiaceae bacterium]